MGAFYNLERGFKKQTKKPPSVSVPLEASGFEPESFLVLLSTALLCQPADLKIKS